MTCWPQHPAAWRVAQACEDNMRRVECAMHELLTAPGASAEDLERIKEGILAMAATIESSTQSEEPAT